MTRRLVPGILLVAVALLAVGALAASLDGDFPHDEHADLFPLCTGCHEGIATGNEADAFPTAASCASCHDGVDEDRVDWTGPSEVPSNLSFVHTDHAAELEREGDEAIACVTCHGEPLADEPMSAIDRAEPEGCLSCHAHESSDHFVAGNCAECHVPLARSGLPGARIAAFEEPADHGEPAFLATAHGTIALGDVGRCSTCHVEDQCASCHVDAGLNSTIQRVPAAPPSMVVPMPEVEYPIPADHETVAFAQSHGNDAPAECVTCHTSDDCVTCHVGAGSEVATGLLRRGDVRAPGADLVREVPASHETAFWSRVHGMRAASDDTGCLTCHEEEAECADCHEGPTGSGFHPDRFLTGHAAEAAVIDADCSNCHSPERFCRECHVGNGMGSAGRLGPGFHDAEPIWLLRHGQAARQQLETCVSCHKQTDCTQCHSTLGAFGVNPHRSGFDPERARARNPASCRACHIGNPTISGGAR